MRDIEQLSGLKTNELVIERPVKTKPKKQAKTPKPLTVRRHTEQSKLKISNSKKGTVRNDLRKVTNDVLGEILSEIKAGVSITAVAKKHGLARKTVYAYIKDYR
jgi:Helix-turn-helix domain/NUMOD3 motif